MMSEKLLRQELIGLRFSHLLELERDVVEGTRHFGVGADAGCQMPDTRCRIPDARCRMLDAIPMNCHPRMF